MDQPSTVTPPAPEIPPSSSPGRRTVLAGAGLAAAALAATACSSTSPTPAPAETTVDDGAAGDSPDGAEVLTTTSEVPVDGGVVVGDVVVTQPEAGTYLAFSTTCPHQGCAVAVQTDTLDCPCHGSEFSLDGAVRQGPATTGLTPVAVEVRGSDIVRA
ncbi:Rieske (2Fe-2S) protein [Gordonia caeni]|uniref:Cytochrome bc1 complex Rieske iron-sulfur subunit n=1 Tax=Gordonia caeni TaxID=1007097 RepID=A0ABP7PEY1_9ACTN